MNTLRITAVTLLACLSLLGCGKNDPAPATDPANEPTTLLGKAVKEATDEARQELATGNIDLSATGHSNAEITPSGELLIEGKAVPVNAEQKALLLEYRGHIAKVAEAGIGIGLEGADLAGKAVTEAVKSIFTGEGDQIEKKIEAEAKGIEQSAQKLCDLLPAMKNTQDKLAAALPAFKPYATMDQSDLEDCMTDNHSDAAGQDVGDAIGKSINSDEAGSQEGMNAAEEAEATGAKQ